MASEHRKFQMDFQDAKTGRRSKVYVEAKNASEATSLLVAQYGRQNLVGNAYPA